VANTFKNTKLKIQSGAGNDVYTCPSATTAIVIGCQVANTDSTTAENVRVWWTDASNSNVVTHLVDEVVVPARSTLAPIVGKLVLEAGDKIRAGGQVNDRAEITVSVLEIS
jgi:uncharacterized linocin/CFP29 family protein